VVGAVGTRGTVELPVGKGGGVVVPFEVPVESITEEEREREKVPVRSPEVVEPLNTDVVKFSDTGGNITDAGGVVSTVIEMLVDVGGRMVERLPVENDGTVE
jgi:hypothetical protein